MSSWEWCAISAVLAKPTLILISTLTVARSLPGVCSPRTSAVTPNRSTHRSARQHRIPAACPYGQETTSKEKFDEWYRFTDGVNQPYLVYLAFAQVLGSSIATFDSQLFFPLDNAGWGNSGTGEDHNQHNFGFTTELHTTFRYSGGERFSFIGDDDSWVFINGKLAMDLGGLHPSATGTLDVDGAAGELGLTPGNVYPLELFHAERHVTASHFRVDTTLSFVDCGYIPPDVK